MADRNEVLAQFKKDNKFKELVTLSESEIENISFSSKEEDKFILALKRMIFSYCKDEAKTTVIKNINLEIN